LTHSVKSAQRGQKAFNRELAGRMVSAEDTIAAYETVTARHRAEDESVLLAAVDTRVAKETSPGRVARRWTADPFVWAVIVLVGVIGLTVEGQWRNTQKVATDNDKRLIVMETTIRQIPVQMKAHSVKIDKILAQMKRPTLARKP